MKKLTALFLILSVCIGAFASVKPIVAFNPAARYSTFEQYGIPQSHKIKDTDLSSWMETSQDIYYRYFDQIGLADLADLGKIRFYGTFAMEDFDLPDEKAKNNGKPGANGVNFGIQYHVFNGEKTETFDNSTNINCRFSHISCLLHRKVFVYLQTKKETLLNCLHSRKQKLAKYFVLPFLNR